MGKVRDGQWFLLLIILSFGVTSHLRNAVWKDELTLWSTVVLQSPRKETPHLNLGNALVRRGRYTEAEREFRQVLAVNPLDSRAINGLAAILYRQERYDDAVRLFLLLATEKPNDPYFQNNLGAAYLAQGNLGEAETHFQSALRLLPGYIDALQNLGVTYQRQGRARDAVETFRAVLGYNPDHAGARMALQEVGGRLGERQ